MIKRPRKVLWFKENKDTVERKKHHKRPVAKLYIKMKKGGK